MKPFLVVVPFLVSFGCAPPTQLAVSVDSDFSSSTMPSIFVTVNDAFDEELGFVQFSVEGLPISFGVQPKGDVRDEEVTVIVQGANIDGFEIVRQQAKVGFVSNEIRELNMFLARSCEGVDCMDDNMTCDRGSCSSALVNVDGLPMLMDPTDGF